MVTALAPVRSQTPPPAPPAASPAAAARPDAALGLPTRAAVVQRHGITWHFAGEHVVGTFANGDPWVVGPVRIVRIEPASVEAGGRVMHGSMVDPDPSSMNEGYDSGLFGDPTAERWKPELNVAFGISAAKPLVLPPASSLVSVQSRPQPNQTPQLQTAAVLTVLGAPPAPDAFRPPYVRGDKTPKHRAIDLDLRPLQKVKALANVPPIENVAAGFERLWLDHFPSWPVRYAHPADNMPDYGRDMAAAVGGAALLLNTDLPDAQKRPLAIRLVQLGIDLHATVRGGCRFEGIGGHGAGRKLPILLAGLLLHDEQMLAIGADFVSRRTAANAGVQYFAEDGQTFYVEETSPGVYNWGHGGYTKEHLGLPEWGFAHAHQIEDDRASWGDNSYRLCCSANGWVGQALAARMLGLQAAWAHPAFFDYMDRFLQAQHAEAWHRSWVGWQASMWDAYRAKY